MTAPTSDLVRQVSFVRADDGVEGDGFTLDGYGAVFGAVTRIDSWEGKFDEVIAPGAFSKTLAERGSRVVLQFDHGHSFLGSLPIGAIKELREDARGLYVKARLFDNDWVKPVRDAIAGGALQGMSFRFEVMGERWDDSGPVPLRTITEVRLHEVGPVVFPAYEATTVGVRARQTAADLTADPEFRDQVVRALLTAGTPAPAADEAPDEGAALPAGAADEARRDRSEDHASVLARISTHLP